MELRTKFPTAHSIEGEKMKEIVLDVPQQPNSYDCGLFLLEYVERFQKNPAELVLQPSKSHLGWFDPKQVVSNNRRNISDIIKRLMTSQGRNPNSLPENKF